MGIDKIVEEHKKISKFSFRKFIRERPEEYEAFKKFYRENQEALKAHYALLPDSHERGYN